MNEKQLYLALSSIIQAIKRDVVNWRLDGSTNLFVQGIQIKPADLDIATNKDGLAKFEKALSRYSPKKEFNEKSKCMTLKCTIAEIPVEISSYEERKELLMFDKIRPMNWSRLYIPILPLDEAKLFYTMIQKTEKVDIINKFQESQK